MDAYFIDEIKGRGDLIYIGLLLSDKDCGNIVETHLTNPNPTLVFISLGIENPEDLIKEAFKKAEDLLNNPPSL